MPRKHKDKNNLDSKTRASSKRDVVIKRKVSSLDVVVGEALNKLTKGGLDNQEQSFEISYNKIYSNSVKMVLQIMNLKEKLEYGYFETIKETIRKVCGNPSPGELDLISVQYCKENKVALGKKARGNETSIKKTLNATLHEKELMLNPKKKYNKYIQEMSMYDPRISSSLESQQATRQELHYIDKKIEQLKRKLQSFSMVDAYQREGGSCMLVYNFIEVVAKDQTLALMAMDRLKEILTEEGFIVREVIDLENYQIAFSPTSLKSILPKAKKQFTGLPYFTLSNTVPLTQKFRPGILRSSEPEAFIGTNIENNYRVDVNFTSSKNNENYLVIGDSGSGKSLFLKTMGLTWMDNSHASMVIKEYKGRGWDKFINIFGDNAEIIRLDLDTPSFVNTYNIPYDSGFGFKTETTPYMISHNISTKILLTLLNGNESPTKTQIAICDSIVAKVFMNAGVDKNKPETYRNSKDINFIDDTWTAISFIASDVEITNTYNKSELNIIKSELSKYFHPNGFRRNIFGREIELGDVIFNKRILAFDYNTHSASSSDNTMDNELYTRILQESFIERLFCAYNSNKNNYTMVITEELDEQINNPYLYGEIAQTWKFASSMNIINFATLQNPSLLYRDSREPIIPTGYIVGNSNSKTYEVLNTNTELSVLGKTLYNVCLNPSMNKSFLVFNKYRRIPTCITKMNLTRDIIMSLEPLKDAMEEYDSHLY